MSLSSILANAQAAFDTSIKNGADPAFSLTRSSCLPPVSFSLTTWLQHSKKKNCDVCQTQYAFKKGMHAPTLCDIIHFHSHSFSVYDPNMPNHIPPFLFLRRVALQMVTWAFVLMRGILVGTVWLVFLPYTTVWMWRFYFWTGEHMFVHISILLTGNHAYCPKW